MKTNTVLSALLGCGLLAVSMSAAAQGIGNPSEKFSAKLNLVATPDAPERAKGTASIKAGSGVEGTGELVLQTIGLEPGDYLVRAVRASDAGTVDIGQFTIEEPPGRGRGRLKSISNAPLPEGLDARDIAQIIVSSGGVDLLVGDLADPASKGGTESSVKLAKADLVPTEANLRDAYDTFADLEAACEAFCDLVNSRPHRVTRRAPVEMLAEERPRLHPVAGSPFTVAFGTTRVVPDNTPMVNFEHGQYSVPHRLCGETVWVRVHGRGADEQIVICHLDAAGPVEVARHRRATPGTPILDDTHFPPAPAGALERTPKPRTVVDTEFLALGEGARIWLIEAAAAGTGKMRVKMAAAVQLARLFNPADVDWALGHAAVHGRFAEADLASILDIHEAPTWRFLGLAAQIVMDVEPVEVVLVVATVQVDTRLQLLHDLVVTCCCGERG